jgi:hemerythrin-like domain-containing protein
MQHPTITIIRCEHRALSAVLRSLELMLSDSKRRGTLPDFGLIRAMLFYVDEYPERLHHKEESELLFPRLRLRSQGTHEVLDRLDREHREGHVALLELEHALLAFELLGPARRGPFEQALQRYVDSYLTHIQVEEAEVLPLAEAALTERDWAELDTVFSLNHDPLTGHPPPDEFSPLFDRIFAAMPAPFGRGNYGRIP